MTELTLKAKMQNYLGKLKALNVPTVKFNCPHCASELETEANTTSFDWDTLSDCWECNRSFLKITRPNGGPVEARIFKPRTQG